MNIKPHQIPQLAAGMARVWACADEAKRMLITDDENLTGSIFKTLPVKNSRKKAPPVNNRQVTSDMLEALKKKFGV